MLKAISQRESNEEKAQLCQEFLHERQPGHPCLLKQLPKLRDIQAEASEAAQSAFTASCIQDAINDTLQPPSPKSTTSPPDHRAVLLPFKSSKDIPIDAPPSSESNYKPVAPPVKPLQPHEVLRAIEKKDLETLFKARDHAFSLLVTPHGGIQPLVHCLRLGKSHQDIAILLTGALSRFVNHIPSDKPPDRQTKTLLNKTRSNLKIAINESLHTNQTDLISSYLQVILMTEGDHWLRNQTQLLSLALRQGKKGGGKPVKTAGEAVRRFATNELKSVDKLAAVEEYTANATADLVLMGVWANVCDACPGRQPLPLYQYAREYAVPHFLADDI